MRTIEKTMVACVTITLCIILIVIACKKMYNNQNNIYIEVEKDISNDIIRQMPMAKQYTTYTVDLSVNEKCDTFVAITQVVYIHQYERPTRQILMSARPMSVQEVQINADPVAFEQRDAMLLIQSPFLIQKGEEVTVTIQFSGTLSDGNKPDQKITWLCDCLPTLATYDEAKGWIRKKSTEQDSYRLLEPANYEVTVHTKNEKYPLATGTMNGISENEGIITTSFSARRVRNFGLIITDKMERVIRNTEDGCSIVFYYTQEDKSWEEAILFIEKSIHNYSGILGTYPYDQLTVVHYPDMLQRASYPTIIVGDFNMQKLSQSDIDQLIGQQWLYYIIGNSQENEWWLSRGLLAYINKRFSLSQGQLQTYIGQLKKLQIEQKDTSNQEGMIICMLYEIEQYVGEEAFIESLRAYYKNYSFQMATGKEFIQMINNVAGKRVNHIYNYWIEKMELKESELYEGSYTSSWET